MTMRLSELNEYSVGVAREPTGVRQLPQDFVPPMQPAREALMRRSYANGLALSEQSAGQGVALNGLGELVQVVT